MLNRFIASLFIILSASFNASAMNSNNPFAKNESLNVGKDVSWIIDKEAVNATKTAIDAKSTYYHLQFDNKQIKLSISTDEQGLNTKSFNQLEIKNVKIDGKQVPLFKWCLANQQRHSRFLQQGLTVKKDICSIDGAAGSFVMRLNKDTLSSLQAGSRLSIMLKPFRTPLDLNYDISDFKDMYIALNARPEPAVANKETALAAVTKKVTKCWAGAPPQYKNINSVEYDCDDAADKSKAEAKISALVNNEKDLQKKLAAERQRQLKLAEEKKQKALALKLEKEKALQAEAAAIAASQAKQAQLSDEITQKMVSVCKKYWDKGEHRCYCQKYIEYAPSSIQSNSTCK